MWLWNKGVAPKISLAHINGNIKDNRIENLRECSDSEFAYNRKMQSNNTSGAKGVCWHKHHKKWVAQYGKVVLGYWNLKSDAVQARNNYIADNKKPIELGEQ